MAVIWLGAQARTGETFELERLRLRIFAEQLEFSDVHFGGGRQNIQSHASSRYGWKTVNFLVADRVSLGQGLPIVPLPRLDPIVLDMLTVIQRRLGRWIA